MRFTQHFCNNNLVGTLLSEFRTSQGPLFHYTNQAASAGIMGGEIWITRADCFLDPKEIKLGLEVLSNAAQVVLNEPEAASFSEVLKTLQVRLKSCFVLSLSQAPDSEYLRSNYAGDNGSVIEFQENFPRIVFHTGWHVTPSDGDSFRNHFVVDVYDFFEGFVVYDDPQQQRLATIACLAYQDLLSTDAHIVDSYQFIDILMQCLVLFKSNEFEAEEEFRVAFIRRHGIIERFEETRDCAGCCKLYIKVRIPSPETTAMLVRCL